MNKIINSRKMQTKKYRIIDEIRTESSMTQSLYSDRRQLQRLTQTLVKQNKYMYIDINEGKQSKDLEKAIKLMKQCSSSDDEDQVDKIGKKYVVNLNNLHTKNSKGINYLFKTREQFVKKDKALSLLANELEKSSEKIEKHQNQRVNSKANLLSIYNSKSAREHSTMQSSLNTSDMCESKIKHEPTKNRPRLYSTISHQKSEKSKSPKKCLREASHFLKTFLPTIKTKVTNKR